MTNCHREGRLIWPRRRYSSMPAEFRATTSHFQKYAASSHIFSGGFSTMETKINTEHFSAGNYGGGLLFLIYFDVAFLKLKGTHFRSVLICCGHGRVVTDY